ncbi:unnamed protein product [Moneuplotes crassus]|uniref:Uncharacterized protein n=1 Tax=Euplotes crassus TaxID=5936 RepID=A0AAD1UNM6_EUPCR|nr:unnamed protein product [Moneuplotes crassus]
MEPAPHPISLRKKTHSRLEKLIASKMQRLLNRVCNDSYYNSYSEEILVNPKESNLYCYGDDKILKLSFHNTGTCDFMKKLNPIPLYDVDGIHFHNFHTKNRKILDFFLHSFPREVNFMTISANIFQHINISYYFDSFCTISSSVRNKVSLWRFKFTENQLKKFLVSYKHVKVVSLSCCYISIPHVINFSRALKNTQIKRLDFVMSKFSRSNDLSKMHGEFKNLMESLATSPDLKLSLQGLSIARANVEKDKALNIIREAGFSQIKLCGFI